MTDRSCRILAGQLAIPAMVSAQDRDRHLAASAEKLRRHLRENPADMVVLPELSSIEYSEQAFGHLDQLSEPLDGPSFQAISKVAREFDVVVVYGIARRHGDRYRISQVAVDGTGELIGHFDKLHIAHYGASTEKDYFERGDSLFVFEHHGLKFAPIICYDIRIPELCRTLAIKHGVDVILHCGAYARDESFASWHAFVVSRAMENQVFFLSLNRAGENFGQSLFCGPWVDAQTPATAFADQDEAFVYLDVDGAEIDRVKNGYSFREDRLESYDSLECMPLP